MLRRPANQALPIWLKLFVAAAFLGALAYFAFSLLHPSQHYTIVPQNVTREEALEVCPFILITEEEYAYLDVILADEDVQAALANTEEVTNFDQSVTQRYAGDFRINGETASNFAMSVLNGYFYVSGETGTHTCIYSVSANGETGKIVGEFDGTKHTFFGEEVNTIYVLENYDNTMFVYNAEE